MSGPRRSARRLCAGMALALAAANARADGCSMNIESLQFGTYDAFNVQPTDSAASITVTCSATSAFTITLSAGGGTYAARTMRHDADQLLYNLYADPAYNLVWGDGIGAASVSVSDTSQAAIHTVYARIPARQNSVPGLYSDNITVTLLY